MDYSRWILLTTSFFEGFIRFPLDALMFYYLRNEVVVEVEVAKALVHLQLCVYYYSMSVLPTLLPKKSPVYLINFISSSLILLSLVIFMIVEFLSDTPNGTLSFESGNQHLEKTNRAQALDTTFRGYAHKCSKIALTILLAIFCGAKTLTVKFIIIKQFSLPAEYEAYKAFRVHRSTVSGLGKICGLLIPVYLSKHGPHLHFRNFFLALSVVSTIDCAILATGFPLLKLRIHDRLPRGLLKFFNLQRRVIKGKFFSKQVQEAELNEQQEAQEEWKALIKVLPLFIPAVLIIAFRDQRYTQYLNQEEMMVPDVRAEIVLPTVLIFVIYPITKMIGTIIVDGLLMPYLKRKGKPLTARDRSIFGYVFVIISLASATILQCRVEKTKSPLIGWEESSIILYNACNCPAMITIRGIDKEIICPPMFIKKIFTPPFLTSCWMTVRVECSNQEKYSTRAHIHLQDGERNVYLVLKDNHRSIAVKKIKTSRSEETFNIHTILRVIVVPFHTKEGHRFADISIQKDGVLDGQYYYLQEDMQYPFFYKDEYLEPGRYFIIVNQIVVLDINITYGASLTYLVSTAEDYRLPDTKLFTLMPPNEISIYYQIPQILILSLSDVMLESPTFIYASNAVPKKWWNLVNDLWLSCGGTGNLITAIAMFVSGINRLVIVFVVGFGLCWLSVAMFIHLSSSVYAVNYEFPEEREKAKTSKT